MKVKCNKIMAGLFCAASLCFVNLAQAQELKEYDQDFSFDQIELTVD